MELDRVAAAAVVGFAVGSLLSTILVVGVFAAISRELGIALRFPARSATSRMPATPGSWPGRALGGPNASGRR